MNTATIEAPGITLEAPQGVEPALPAHKPNNTLAGMKAGGGISAIIPQTMDDAFRLAKLIAVAGWAPKSYLIDSDTPRLGYSPEKIAIAIMQGLEVGLTPMAAVQSIAVINGMPSLWGDGALAVVRASGLLEDFREEKLLDAAGKLVGYRCTALRLGENEPAVQEFTMEDARKANLDKKSGPWQQYPQRMCQMRARAWVLRDKFTDALKGFKIAEEVQDFVDMGAADEVKKERRAIAGTRPKTLDSFAAKKTGSENVSIQSQSDSAPIITNGKLALNSDCQDADRIAPTSPAEQQSGDTDDLIGASMNMPAAAARQYREKGLWMPAYTWLSATLPKIADPKVKQEFVDTFREFFESARNSGAAYQKNVDKLMKEQGVIFDSRN